jgi:hypothetical protein
VGRIAPRITGWRLRNRNLPGPVRATGEAGNGEPVMAEMLLAGVWTDVTSYVMVRDGSQKINVVLRGQSAESSSPDRSTCQFQLNNRDGRFTPRNPTGPYYGLIGRNTQIRFSVPDGYGGKSYRFWGEMTAWPQNWDPTGADIWVDAEACGPMRRYSQGHAPTRSVLYEALTGTDFSSTLLAYWPCEDIAGSTTIASALTGRAAMTISGTPDLAVYDAFGSSDPLPTMTDSAFTGVVPQYTDPTATQVRFLLAIPADGASDGKVTCRIHQSDTASVAAYWELIYVAADGTLLLRQHDADGALLGSTLAHTLDTRGKLLRVSIELQENGTGTDRAVRTLDVTTGAVVSVTDTAALTAVENVLSVSMCPASISVVGPVGTRGITNGTVGHVTLQNAITSITDLGDRLNPAGEAAGRRIQRVCAEHGIPFDWIGDLDLTEPMGPQGKLRPLELIEECAAADLGILYENLSAFGLGYRTRTSLYNQDPTLTLTYASGQLAEVPLPTDDDRYSKNSVAVTRTGGNTVAARLETGGMSVLDPPAGIGEYGDAVTINVATDAQLTDQAGWRVHLGTVDEARYPRITVNLAHPQFTANPALRTAVLALRPGDRLAITGPLPQQAPDDVSVLVLGFAESIDQFQHVLSFNCAPESPWRVATVDDPVYGRLDTAGSELAAAATSTAATLSVTTTSGPLWVADPGETPFDLRIGGEVVTVTTVGSVINANPFFTSDASDWTAQNSSIARITTAIPPNGAAALLITPDGAAASGGALATMSGVGTVTAGASYVATLWAYSPGGWADLRPAVDWADSAGTYLSTSLGSAFTVPAGVWTLLSQTLTAPASASRATMRARHGSTPAATDVWYAAAIRLIPVTSYNASPQTPTVTRSVNSVVKAQAAGADVRLAHPATIAL